MVQTPGPANLADAASQAVVAIQDFARQRRSQVINGVDVRSAIDDMCIEMHMSVNQLPPDIRHAWDIASAERTHFTAQVVIDMLNKHR